MESISKINKVDQTQPKNQYATLSSINMGLYMRIGRIKTKVTRIGRIDARGVLAGRKTKTKN